MKRTVLILGFTALVAVLILMKIFVFSGKKAPSKQAQANPPVPVECYVAKDTAVGYQLETVGTLRANEQVEVVSEISRKVVAIYMKEGEFVKAGQLLYKLDDADITSRIEKLTIEARLARTNESRAKVLLEKGGISQERYDELSNQYQTLQAEIEVLKVDLSKTEIRAPFSGRIGLRNVSIGALVNPRIVLANLQDIGRMKIDFSLPERYSRDLPVGSKIDFQTDYLPVSETAVVEAIEPAVDEKTRTLAVRAVADNQRGKLVAGTSAKVILTFGGVDKSIFVPTSALIPSIKGYSVFIRKDGVAHQAQVRVGLRNREFVQITDGIVKGDTVVVTNLLRVRKESPLKVIKAS